jgi:hypothetical protein
MRADGIRAFCLNGDVSTLVFGVQNLHRYPQLMNQRVVPIHRDGGTSRSEFSVSLLKL